MPDEIRDILSFGQQIMERVWRSESDVVYHILAPLLVAAGWERGEIYFEWGQRKSTSDIALIPSGATKPILTIEAKAPNQKIGLYVEGWSRPMDIMDIGKRNDPARQVFLQLVTIKRLTDQPYGFLGNGRDFSLFTLQRETEHLYNMVCLYSTTISDVLKNDVAAADFRRFLSRSTYRENNCGFLVTKLRDLSPKAISTEGKPIALEQSLESASKQRAIELPDDWYEVFQGWAKSFEGLYPWTGSEFQYFKSICDPQRLTPFEKMSFFEVMRFCHILSPKLPNGWRLVFKRGQKIANINIRLYPNWLPTELQGLSLFQITPNGKYSSGFIWFNAPPDSKFKEQREGTPLWYFYKIKLDMKSKLPKAYIYEDGMVERLISLLDESVNKLIDAGLVSEAIRENGKREALSINQRSDT